MSRFPRWLSERTETGTIVRTTSLSRPRHDRMVAGVCSGIAHRLGISPTVVRIAFVASLLLPGPQILIYLAGWVLMPQESNTLL